MAINLVILALKMSPPNIQGKIMNKSIGLDLII